MKGWLDTFLETDFGPGVRVDPHASLKQWMDRWRRNPSNKPPLAEWCGLTEEELADYVRDPESLQDVLNNYGLDDEGCCSEH